jgi:hypothetical protein
LPFAESCSTLDEVGIGRLLSKFLIHDEPIIRSFLSLVLEGDLIRHHRRSLHRGH